MQRKPHAVVMGAKSGSELALVPMLMRHYMVTIIGYVYPPKDLDLCRFCVLDAKGCLPEMLDEIVARWVPWVPIDLVARDAHGGVERADVALLMFRIAARQKQQAPPLLTLAVAPSQLLQDGVTL